MIKTIFCLLVLSSTLVAHASTSLRCGKESWGGSFQLDYTLSIDLASQSSIQFPGDSTIENLMIQSQSDEAIILSCSDSAVTYLVPVSLLDGTSTAGEVTETENDGSPTQIDCFVE
jgi:hypothetical protein